METVKETTICNAKELMRDLRIIIPSLNDEEKEVLQNPLVDINITKKRFQIFIDNNLLIRYLIESEDLLEDEDRSNKASALRLMRENINFQNENLTLKSNELDLNRIRAWVESLKDKRRQLEAELTEKNNSVKDYKEIFESYTEGLKLPKIRKIDADSMQQALAETETTAAQLKTEVEHLEEQLDEIRDNVEQLSQLAKETAADGDCDSADSTVDIDQQLKEKIDEADDNGVFEINDEDKYQHMDYWRRMLQWEKTFTQKEVTVLGCLSDYVICNAIRDSFDKFTKIHMKPTKCIRYSSINELFRICFSNSMLHKGTMKEAADFVKESEKFAYWKDSLYFLRGHVRRWNCSTLPALDAYR